jgi:chromosome segregation protein
VYLKALEIQGFKSFPDKTVLHFGGDITAIVGPNGSGKSNISDAIRWVMGEQSSRALRGAKMEDVIFGGTAKRSQVGFAEVSLVLDNADGRFAVDAPEVMVTRRYFRSGESEYYINRQSARLRDVNELFMDTGLGREGYSNIGQGRIDEILSVKSQDRREIFEEAAGISKYRHRKEETERKLASAEENLLRIGDKIAELELQVEPLRIQAEKAKEYLAYREVLRGLEVTVWLDTLEKLGQTARKAEEDYRSASFALEQAHSALEELYARTEGLSEELRNRDVQMETQREQITALEQQTTEQEGQTAVLQARRESNLQNMDRIRQELDAQQSRSGTLNEQISQSQDRMTEIENRLQELQTELLHAMESAKTLTDSASDLTEELLACRTRQAELLSAAAEKKAAWSALEASADTMRIQAEKARQDQAEALARKTDLETQAEECRSQLQAAKEAAEAASNVIAGYTLRLKTRQEKRDTLEREQNAAKVELDTLTHRINLLREMERDYEGFSKAVRVVMQEAERGTLKNIHAPVSRLLQTKDTYTLAIETALGASMQSIVVSTDNDGKAAINLLKRRDAGRATFLPMSAIRGRVMDEPEAARCPGYVGIASELITFEAQYQEIFNNLLGRTIIAENLDRAVEMARRFHYRFRIVTLDGHVLNAGGSMTGGSAGRNAGILSRANTLQKLDADKTALEMRLQKTKEQLEEASRAAAETEYAIREAEGRLRQSQDEVLRLEGQKGQYEILIQAADASIAQSARVLEETEQSGKTAQSRRQELQTQLETLEQQAKAQESRAAELAEGQAELSAQNDAIGEKITEIRMASAALEAEKATAAENVRQMQELEISLQGDRTEKASLLETLEMENQSLASEIAQSEAKTAQLQQQAMEARQVLRTQADGRMQLEAERNGIEKKAQDQNKDIVLMERESARLEQKKVSAELEEKQIIDKLWDSYELTPGTAEPFRQEVESMQSASRKITELRRKISALGSPNLGAIEEFARVNERYTYLTGQRDDILTSKRELSDIVRGITEEMTGIFRTEFEKINREFETTFTEMFGGGAGHLLLEDENDVLSCGIEIKVQPPGKQLKTITLLSGGEKALVAIALYFAILKVRPTPFCMLDEIDAALDDRNVTRYAAYLRRLSDKTQFIVITHRRGTMEEADVLYGVTMQEQGVSRMLSIDLNEMTQKLGIQA